MVAAVTATAGDLLLTGKLAGDFLALTARTGDVRYRVGTGGPIGGGIITYAVDGTQYIAVALGNPSNFWTSPHAAGTPLIVVLALPDRARPAR
jgi:alcohol dehydrogenase (cytochrome c)